MWEYNVTRAASADYTLSRSAAHTSHSSATSFNASATVTSERHTETQAHETFELGPGAIGYTRVTTYSSSSDATLVSTAPDPRVFFAASSNIGSSVNGAAGESRSEWWSHTFTTATTTGATTNQTSSSTGSSTNLVTIGHDAIIVETSISLTYAQDITATVAETTTTTRHASATAGGTTSESTTFTRLTTTATTTGNTYRDASYATIPGPVLIDTVYVRDANEWLWGPTATDSQTGNLSNRASSFDSVTVQGQFGLTTFTQTTRTYTDLPGSIATITVTDTVTTASVVPTEVTETYTTAASAFPAMAPATGGTVEVTRAYQTTTTAESTASTGSHTESSTGATASNDVWLLNAIGASTNASGGTTTAVSNSYTGTGFTQTQFILGLASLKPEERPAYLEAAVGYGFQAPPDSGAGQPYATNLGGGPFYVASYASVYPGIVIPVFDGRTAATTIGATAMTTQFVASAGAVHTTQSSSNSTTTRVDVTGSVTVSTAGAVSNTLSRTNTATDNIVGGHGWASSQTATTLTHTEGGIHRLTIQDSTGGTTTSNHTWTADTYAVPRLGAVAFEPEVRAATIHDGEPILVFDTVNLAIDALP